MSSEFDDQPYSDSNLHSPEYRKRLMRKLNTLIAVLEVAGAKVRRSLAGKDPDVDRLKRIQKNLRDTLQVCRKAKSALERCEDLPEDFPASLSKVTRYSESAKLGNQSRGSGVEMSSAEEAEKFDKLGPIESKEILSCDFDDLCRQLLD